jgi:hypothetical protein
MLWLAACLAVVGCEPEALRFTEVKSPHDAVTPAEWATFVQIVERLPERRVPPFPPVFPPAPQWDAGRSALVKELSAEEIGQPGGRLEHRGAGGVVRAVSDIGTRAA